MCVYVYKFFDLYTSLTKQRLANKEYSSTLLVTKVSLKTKTVISTNIIAQVYLKVETRSCEEVIHKIVYTKYSSKSLRKKGQHVRKIGQVKKAKSRL